MPIDLSKIDQLETEGVSPDDILAGLSSADPGFRQKIQTLGQENISSLDILSGIKDSMPPPQAGLSLPSPGQQAITPFPAPQPESLAIRAIGNIPRSAYDYLKNTATALTSPMQTARSIGEIAEGAIQSLIPGEDPSEEAFRAVVDFYKNRYGGLEEIKKTFAGDPVGFMADASFILGMGGSSVAKIAQSGGKIRSVAQAVAKVGRSLDPLRAAGIAISQPVKAVGKIGALALGRLTGRGGIAIEQAFKNAPDFVSGLKGDIDMVDVIKDAKGGLQVMADQRRTLYRTRLTRIKGITAGTVDVRPIRAKLTKWFNSDHFNLKIDPATGVIDDSRSVLKGVALNEAKEIQKIILDWGSQADDFSPLGMDLLKRTLDKFYASNSDIRAMVSDLRNEVKNQIIKKVPQYHEMTKDYSKAIKLQHEMERTLSLGSKASPDATIRKLNSVLKSDNNFRLELVEQLSRETGMDLPAAIAGTQLNKLGPQGLIGALADFGAASTMLRLGEVNPGLVLLMAGSSPKLVAQTMRLLGGTTRAVRKVSKAASFVTPTAFQIGRAGAIAREQEQPILE